MQLNEKLCAVRVFILILFLILSIQSWAKADDIKDFEIEGISVGDSLLNKYSTNEINEKINDVNTFYYKDNKFLDIFFKLNNSTYEWAQITIKPKDNKFIVYSIAGQIDYIDNIKKCYKDMGDIFFDIKENFPPLRFEKDVTITHSFDKTGNSTGTYSRLFYNNGVVSVECYDWSEELPYTDKLLISSMSSEFRNFINDEAY